jgi:hypothetical protein
VIFTYVDDAVLKINSLLHRKRPAHPTAAGAVPGPADMH